MVAAADRVRVTWEGTGTSSPITLGSAISSKFFAPPSVLDGETVSYLIEHQGEGVVEAEWGRGVYTHSGTTLARTEIIGSTNGGIGGSAVSFAEGVKHVSLTLHVSDLQGRFISALPVATPDPAADYAMFLDATDAKLKRALWPTAGGSGVSYGEIEATPTEDVFVLDVSAHNADPAHKTVVTVANDTNIQVPDGAAASYFRILCSHTGCTISITGDPEGRVINGVEDGDPIGLAGDGATVELFVRGSNVIRTEGDYSGDSIAVGDVDMDGHSIHNAVIAGALTLGTGGSISDEGPISASGALAKATHGGRAVLTSGNVVIPNTSGDVGMGGVIILGGSHTITFNSETTAPLAAGDVFTYYVQSTTVLKRSLLEAADQPAMSA